MLRYNYIEHQTANIKSYDTCQKKDTELYL